MQARTLHYKENARATTVPALIQLRAQHPVVHYFLCMQCGPFSEASDPAWPNCSSST